MSLMTWVGYLTPKSFSYNQLRGIEEDKYRGGSQNNQYTGFTDCKLISYYKYNSGSTYSLGPTWLGHTRRLPTAVEYALHRVFYWCILVWKGRNCSIDFLDQCNNIAVLRRSSDFAKITTRHFTKQLSLHQFLLPVARVSTAQFRKIASKRRMKTNRSQL